jgi:hypothetical protein
MEWLSKRGAPAPFFVSADSKELRDVVSITAEAKGLRLRVRLGQASRRHRTVRINHRLHYLV